MDDPTKVQFHYIKSNLFRVVHVDGAYGGLTPQLNVFLSMYSDRLPIPEMQVMSVNDSGQLVDEIVTERVSKRGIIREVEVGIVMSVANARSLIDFLTVKVEQAEMIQMEKAGKEESA